MDEKQKFREVLGELVSQATENGNQISAEELQVRMGQLGMSEEQLRMICGYLAEMKIRVEGMDISVIKGEVPHASETEEDREEVLLAALSEEDRDFLEEYLQSLEDAGSEEPLSDHMRRCAQLALPYAGRGVPLEDLIQEGNVGLVMALDTLELREDAISEADYIKDGIRGAIEALLEEEAGQNTSDEEILKKMNFIGDAIRKLSEELERKVTLEELATHLDMPEEEVAAVLRLTGEDIKTEKEAKEEQESSADSEKQGQGVVGYASVEDFRIY